MVSRAVPRQLWAIVRPFCAVLEASWSIVAAFVGGRRCLANHLRQHRRRALCAAVVSPLVLALLPPSPPSVPSALLSAARPLVHSVGTNGLGCFYTLCASYKQVPSPVLFLSASSFLCSPPPPLSPLPLIRSVGQSIRIDNIVLFQFDRRCAVP